MRTHALICPTAVKLRYRVLYFFFAGLVLTGISLPVAAQQKRLYIAIDDHTDYMWSADEAAYDSAFVQMLDFYLKKIDSTKNLPADFQARFNTDGSLWLKAFERNRSPRQFAQLIAAIRSGHISSPLNMLVSCYGAQPTEAVLRGMYYAGSLERKYHLNFAMAGSMENNTLPLGLASLWAGAGASYSWKGIGGYGSQMSYEMRAHRKFPMYRYNGPDGSGVLMKWYAYNEKTFAPLGGYAECRLHMKYKDLANDLSTVISNLEKYSDTIGYDIASAFGFGHDDVQTLVMDPFIQATQAASNSKRKLRLSNEEDFFADFKRSYPDIPSQSVSYGNEWDLLCATMNETTAKLRRATEKLRTAEALAAVLVLRQPNFMDGLQPMREKAWESLGCYWEHNWTGDGPVSRAKRAAWQQKLQGQLSTYVDSLQQRAAPGLGNIIRQSATLSYYVFNPLGWKRSDVADLPFERVDLVTVYDKVTDREVASQWIIKEGHSYLRILAENIPSVGYKIFEIKKARPAQKRPAASFNGQYFSNAFYRLRLSKSGAITEWFDRLQHGRQVAKFQAGRSVNDLGASNPEDGAALAMENSGPVSVTLKAVSNNPLPHTVRVTLYAHSRRIDIEDSIQANFSDLKTWAFSFDLSNPTTRHEELGAILTAKKESRGGDYADQNARYDWQTFNHFADLSEQAYGITISNLDCSFFKLGKSSLDSLCEQAADLHALAGGNIDKKVEDGGILGIIGQNGNKDFSYHFSLTTHANAFDAAEAMRFSLEHQNPLVAGRITGDQKQAAGNTYSLLGVSAPAVFCWSVKPAEDGADQGLIARLWNLSTSPVNTSLRMNYDIRSAWKTSHVEVDKEPLKSSGKTVSLSFRPWQINTFRLQPVHTGK